jgi:hypothetical protein
MQYYYSNLLLQHARIARTLGKGGSKDDEDAVEMNNVRQSTEEGADLILSIVLNKSRDEEYKIAFQYPTTQ